MNKSRIGSLLNRLNTLTEEVNESITLTWDAKTYEGHEKQWREAVGRKYPDTIGKFRGERNIKIDGEDHWLFIFEKAAMIGRNIRPGAGQVLYVTETDNVNLKGLRAFKRQGTGNNEVIKAGDVTFVLIPEKVIGIKQLVEMPIFKKEQAQQAQPAVVATPEVSPVTYSGSLDQRIEMLKKELSKVDDRYTVNVTRDDDVGEVKVSIDFTFIHYFLIKDGVVIVGYPVGIRAVGNRSPQEVVTAIGNKMIEVLGPNVKAVVNEITRKNTGDATALGSYAAKNVTEILMKQVTSWMKNNLGFWGDPRCSGVGRQYGTKPVWGFSVQDFGPRMARPGEQQLTAQQQIAEFFDSYIKQYSNLEFSYSFEEKGWVSFNVSVK